MPECQSPRRQTGWERQLSGPLYQYDDRLVTVSLCEADVSAATLEPMIELIRSHFDKRKAGTLRKREETATAAGLRFHLKGPEDWAIFELRSKGKLPWSTTVWRHNAGRRYEVREPPVPGIAGCNPFETFQAAIGIPSNMVRFHSDQFVK